MNLVITDNRVSDRCSKSLAAFGYVVVRLPSFWGLSAPVCSHPDMLLFKKKDGGLLTSREYYEEAKDFFDIIGITPALTDEKLRAEYPRDVLFDALAVGERLYGKEGFVSSAILSEYEKFVPVNQGYARCSVAMLSDNCAVTSDPTLAAALSDYGVRVLKIRPGYISLPGYDTGFIGGAGGRLDDGTYCFFGDIFSHPDGERIVAFADENKIKTVSLSGEPLSDHGGFITLQFS